MSGRGMSPRTRAAWFSLLAATVLQCGCLVSAAAASTCTGATPDWMSKADALNAPVKPEQCARVAQSPPDFSWPDLGRDASYRMTLTYPSGSSRTLAAPANWIVWDEVLPAGEYTWTVRAERPAGTTTSSPRRFSVSATASPFLVPEAEALYTATAAMARPRGFPRGAERAELVAALGEERRDAFARLVARVEAAGREPLPAEPRVRVNLVTDAVARSAASVEIQRVATVESARVQEAAFAWRITNRSDHLQSAKTRLLNLAAWDAAGATGVKSQDLANRYIAWALALGYDWLYEALSGPERARVLAAASARQAAMFDQVLGSGRIAAAPFDSHGEVVLTSVAAISALLAGDVPEGRQWFKASVPLHASLVSPWGGEDGGYGNGTAYAQWYFADAVIPWDVLRWSTGLDVRKKPWVRELAKYFAFFLPPGTPTGLFGDGAEVRRTEEWARYGKAYAARVQSPLTNWYARQLFGEDSASLMLLLAPRASAAAPFPPGTAKSIALPSVGWAAMHSNLADRSRVSVYFKSSPYGSHNHSHADQNSFVISADGRPLAIASGYYDFYESPHWQNWYRRTIAHNAITFDDGRGQASYAYSTGFGSANKAAQGRLLSFEQTEDYDIVVGDAAAAYGGELTRARRSLVYLRPNIVVVIDSLASGTERQWEWNIHAHKQMQAASGQRVVIRNEDTSLCVDMFGSRALAFRQSDAFTRAPQVSPAPPQWHGVFSSARGRDMQFVAVMDVNCSGIPGLQVDRIDGNEWVLSVAGKTIRYRDDVLTVQ